MNLRQFYYALSPKLRRTARRMYYFPADILDTLMGNREDLQPPRGMVFTGGGDFRQQGQEFLQHFKNLGNLQPHHRVLDIGSGIGRMAIPLTQYLNEKGRYDGFDIVKEGVEWCQKNVSAKYPNFHFQQVHLKNDLYSNEGESAAYFTFPFDNNTFNFSFLTSVFTHMLPEQVDNYIKEISRVTAKNGRCLATFFLYNEAIIQRTTGDDKFGFPYDYGHYRLMDDAVKSANVAFDIPYLKDLAAKHGLKIVSINHGHWSELPKGACLNFQDIVIFEKG